MIELVKIVRVEKLGEYRLRLHFSDGTEGVRDLSDIVAEGGPMVEPLKDTHFFRAFFLSMAP